MAAVMNSIRELLEREPFVPFQVVMNSGDRFTIENPGLVMLDEQYLKYYLPRSSGEVHLRVNQIAYFHINHPEA